MGEQNKIAKKYGELCYGKEEYLICAKDAGKSYEIESLYNRAQIAYRNLNTSLYNELAANVNLHDAQKPKLDPYIMGGIADGIAGPAAGIYTAAKTGQNNANKESTKSYWKEETYRTHSISQEKTYDFYSIVDELDNAVNSLPNVKKARNDISRRRYIERMIEENKNYLKNAKTYADLNMYSFDAKYGYLVTGILFIGLAIGIFSLELPGFGIAMLLCGIVCFCFCRVFWSAEKPKKSKREMRRELEEKNEQAKKNIDRYERQLEEYKLELKNKTYK